MKKLCFLVPVLMLSACLPLKSASDALNSQVVTIPAIQGCAHRSPYADQTVNGVQGVVTWKVENGFYMQSLQEDELACTSEGIFVFTNAYPSVTPGDQVAVDGKVQEFTPGSASDHNLSVTEIVLQSFKKIASDVPIPEPFLISAKSARPLPTSVIAAKDLSTFDADTAGLDYWESLEGMLVEIENAVVVGPRNKYGEMVVVPSDALPANIVSVEGALIQTHEDANPERLVVELPVTYKKSLDMGDRFAAPLVGVISYDYGNYRLLEQNLPDVISTTFKMPTLPSAEGESIRVATYNLNNWNRFDESRTRQIAKQIVKNLASPDILLLEEVQDDSGTQDDGVTSADKNLLALTKAIEEQNGPIYLYYDPPTTDGENGGMAGANIRTVVLYREDAEFDFQSLSIDRFHILRSAYNGGREPLLLQFEREKQKFFVIGVHFVSNNLNTPLFGSVQPIEKPEEAKRILQAQQVATIADQLTQEYGALPILVLGDFNDDSWSDTLSAFSKTGFADTSDRVDATERFSILYEGNAQQFDHILLRDENGRMPLKNSWILHLNTPLAELDQVSDHDPLVAEFELR